MKQPRRKHFVVRGKNDTFYCGCRKDRGASMVREVIPETQQYTGVVRCFWSWKKIPGKHI